MARPDKWGTTLFFQAAFVLLAAACGGGEDRRPPDVDLPVGGSGGGLPPGPVAVVTIEPGGAFVLDGRRFDAAGLAAALAPLADRERIEDNPWKPSVAAACLRAPAALPFREFFDAMELCARPEIRINRIHIAVRTPDGRGRSLALYRETERGIWKTHGGAPIPPNLVHAALALPAGGRPVVAALVAAVRDLPAGFAARPVWVGVDPATSIGDVVLLLDALARLGAERVRLEVLGAPVAAPLLNDRELPAGDPAVLASLPPARLSEDPVGFTTPCEWPWQCPPTVIPVGR